MFCQPLQYFSTFAKVFLGNIRNPDFLCKTIIAWPKTVGFAWVAKKQRISHVHGQWATYPATMALVVSRLNNIPFSFTGHAHDIYLDTTMLAQKMDLAAFVTTCTINNKKYLLDVIRKHYMTEFNANKIIVNYHGVDLDIYKNDKPRIYDHQLFRILSVGSLVECKGYNYLIDACKILKDKGLNIHCIIAGGGKLESNLRAQITQLGLSNEIELTGYITQDKLVPVYGNANVFVLPMIPEIHWGIPNVLIEAMAFEVPVVCTMLPSIPELLEDGKTGFIIPPKNSESIANIIEMLHKNKELRKKVAVSGRKVIEQKFDVVKNAEKLKDLFLNK